MQSVWRRRAKTAHTPQHNTQHMPCRCPRASAGTRPSSPACRAQRRRPPPWRRWRSPCLLFCLSTQAISPPFAQQRGRSCARVQCAVRLNGFRAFAPAHLGLRFARRNAHNRKFCERLVIFLQPMFAPGTQKPARTLPANTHNTQKRDAKFTAVRPARGRAAASSSHSTPAAASTAAAAASCS